MGQAHSTTLDTASESSVTPLLAALAYARRGWPVFPCHTPQADRRCSCWRGTFCKAIGKHPRTKHSFRDATTDPTLITRWWTKWPDANIGIRTGQESGLVVIDMDPRHGGADTLAALERIHSTLPETLEALTGGGGRHLLFAHPGGYISSGTDVLGPGIDIKADGGYVIAPPSRHATGNGYIWEVCHEPEDVPLAPLPPWVRESVGTPAQEGIRLTPHASKTHTPEEEVFLLANTSTDVLSFPLSGPVTQADQMALLRRRDVVERCLPLLRLQDVPIGTKYCCVVHPEEHPSAAIYPPREGHRLDTFAYLDFHGTERKAYPLPVIYWSLISGKPPKKLPKPTLVTWTTRLLVDAGVLLPPPIPAPKLPADAPDFVGPVYEGFCFLLQCKGLIKAWKTPYTWKFAADWTGQSQHHVKLAMRWLLAHGMIVMAGIENDLMCFLLGTRSLMRRLGHLVEDALKRTQEVIVEAVQPVREALWKDNATPTAAPCAAGGHRWIGGPDWGIRIQWCQRCLVWKDPPEREESP